VEQFHAANVFVAQAPGQQEYSRSGSTYGGIHHMWVIMPQITRR
jgi:hypothetical protein